MTNNKKLNNDESEPVEKNSVPFKKRTLTILILKWIGKVILALLLILAFIFQAPWKIITLLAIFFFACFILPKQLRKWFWLGVGTAVLILLVWVFLPEDDTGWRPYTFDEEVAAFRAKFAIPDDENAASAYYEILRTLDTDSNQPEFFIRTSSSSTYELTYEFETIVKDSNQPEFSRKTSPSSITEPWLSKDHPYTAEWLEGHQDTIEKLIQTSGKEKCLFSINVDPFQLSDNSIIFSHFRNCVYLLIATANNDIAEGRTSQAIQKLICILNIAAHLQQQPEPIFHRLGMTYEAQSLSAMNRLILEGDLTNEQLQIISGSIRQLENKWSENLQKFLDFEKLYCKNGLAGEFYERDPKGKSRITRLSSPVNSLLEQQTSVVNYTRRKCAKLGVILLWLYLPSSPQKISDLVDKYYEKYYAMVKPDFDWNKQPDSLKAKLSINYRHNFEIAIHIMSTEYHDIHEKYLNTLTMRRGSRLLIAIRQYKDEHDSWPESLEEIKSAAPMEAFLDPVTGKQLEYENHGDRFSLYGAKTNVWPR